MSTTLPTIKTIEGDLLDAQRGFIIHGCNNQGVMGSGVARGVRARFPHAYAVYKQAEATTGLGLGTCSFYQHKPDLWIVNGVTQSLGVRDPLDIGALTKCFASTLEFMLAYERAAGFPQGMLPLLFPLIGAGRGGGDWAVISDKIVRTAAIYETIVNVKRELVLYTVKQEPADCR